MSLALFIKKIQNNEPVSFDETIAVISDNYDYRAVEFTNGDLVNKAGTNEGSCKIFAFAQLHQLNQQQTLALFGDYYRRDVLGDPEGAGHQNIRNFMRYGWAGVRFDDSPLLAKNDEGSKK